MNFVDLLEALPECIWRWLLRWAGVDERDIRELMEGC